MRRGTTRGTGAARLDWPVKPTYDERMVATVGTEDISRSLGRLEGQVGSIGKRLGSIEQRLDRVIFALFGFGAALAAGIVGILVKLFLDAA